MEHTFNLGSWLSRLGIKGGKAPPVLPGVQPVQVVGDASLLTPALLPATGIFGHLIAAVLNEYAVAQVFSLAPGGTLVRSFEWSLTAAHVLTYTVSDTPLTFGTTEDTETAVNIGPEPIVSVVKTGTVINANRLMTADHPCLRGAANVGAILDDVIYIPKGMYFQCCAVVSANSDAYLSLVIQDLPAAAGPE